MKPKIFYIESNPSFNRYDILKRITRLSRHLTHIDVIQVILLYKKPNTYIIRNGETITLFYDNPLHHLLSELIKCNKITLLDENSKYDTNTLFQTECFLAGLHTDIPEDILKTLSQHVFFEKIKLSNIPYPASTLLAIIDMYFKHMLY